MSSDLHTGWPPPDEHDLWCVSLLGASLRGGAAELRIEHEPGAHRKAVLPLNDKRWARLLRGPSPAWRDVTIGRSRDDEERGIDIYRFAYWEVGKPLNAAAVVDWLTRRSG